VTAAAQPSFAVASEAPHLTAALAALAVIACGLVAVQLYAWQLEQRYVRSLTGAITPWHHKSHSLAIDRLAFSQPDLLPVYGSSELIVGAPHDADELFKDYPTGFRPFEVATSAATPIIMMMRLASMGAALAGRRVVISITPAEFYRPHLEQPSYKANFSRVQATTLAFDSNIPYRLRRAAAQRMLQYPTTVADDPILRWGLESLADRSGFGQARYAAVLPLGLLQAAVLRLADHWQFITFVHQHPELHRSETVVPVPINWATLEAHVDNDALHRAPNNPFGFRDDYWTANGYKLERPMDRSRLMPVVPLMVNGLHHEPRNLEWRDFALLLDIVHSLGGRPLVVSAPLSGPFLDYWGVTSVERAQYYDELRDRTSHDGVPLVDFADHDEDRGFVRDPESHLNDKGWVRFDEVLDAWFHGAPVPDMEPALAPPASASTPLPH
jgi:D-alanine transfer protein